MPRTINPLLKVCVLTEQNKISLPECEASFTQADKEWRQSLSNLPSFLWLLKITSKPLAFISFLFHLFIFPCIGLFTLSRIHLLFQPSIAHYLGAIPTSQANPRHISARNEAVREIPRQRERFLSAAFTLSHKRKQTRGRRTKKYATCKRSRLPPLDLCFYVMCPALCWSCISD